MHSLDAPKTLEETGLGLSFITDLVLKHVLFRGGFTITDVAASVKLPRSIVNAALEELRRKKFIEVKGASQFTTVSYQFQITERERTGLQSFLIYAGMWGLPQLSWINTGKWSNFRR